MIVMGLVITSHVLLAAAQRSDVEDVATNSKPSDDDTKPSNDLSYRGHGSHGRNGP
jgi:hypothetical protein